MTMKVMRPFARIILIVLAPLCLLVYASPGKAAILLPRMGAVIELEPVNATDPWEDRSLRVQWVLARLQNEGHRVWLLDPQGPLGECQVLYLDGPGFKTALPPLATGSLGLLQSDSRRVVDPSTLIRTQKASPRVSLLYQKSGPWRVVTVSPDLAECFGDYEAVKALGDAVTWLAGLPDETPRIAPFPRGKRSALVVIVHGEGHPTPSEAFQRELLPKAGPLTYVVSEEAVQKYPEIIRQFLRDSHHEVAVHNHTFLEYQNQRNVLSANLRLHKEALSGHRPRGLVGPYLAYFDDLREALREHEIHWFMDKDLPYPMNIPLPPDAEPTIDITESLKPYDGWWKREDAAALWQLGLIWKLRKSEVAVCSWHDVHMAAEPGPYVAFLRWAQALPDVWQATALQVQTFWRDRWRSRVEILSCDDRTVTLKADRAPSGLTLFREIHGKKEFAILGEAPSGKATLEWNPLPSVEEPGEPSGIDVKWGLVGGLSSRNQTDTEFAVLYPGKSMLYQESIAVNVPQGLQSRIRKSLPTLLRLSAAGVKGLEFKELLSRQILQDASVPTLLSFKVDRFPAQSIRFFRLRFPAGEKRGVFGRWERSIRKRPWLAGCLGVIAVVAAILGMRAFWSRRSS